MLLFKLVTILLVVALSEASYVRVPPKIEVFAPKGFSISIEDQPGITSVEFHIKLPKDNSNKPKEFFKVIQRPRQGRWTFTHRKASLEIGKLMNYSILIIQNHHGFRVEGSFLVKEAHKPNKTQSTPTPCKVAAPSMPIQQCEKIMFNTTQKLMSLEIDKQALIKINHQLTKALEKYPDAKQLTLSGRIPPDDAAAATVAFILREKLDLEPQIVSATRNSNDNITFDVATVSEKMEILEMAKYKLVYSKIYIS